MSTATAFKYYRAFPFCVEDWSADYASEGIWDYVGNLSLTTVMAFFWNMETFTITTTGSATDAGGTTSGASTEVMNPLGGSPWTGMNLGAAIAGNLAWYPQTASHTAFASCPSIFQPDERVCSDAPGGTGVHGVIASLTWMPNAPDVSNFQISFGVSLDPSNAGKYRLYYAIDSDMPDVGLGPSLSFKNPAAIGADPVIASGTFTLGGQTLSWAATDYGTSTSSSGLGISATSSFFTY